MRIGVALLVTLLCTLPGFAQRSVEKLETSQQAKQPEDELARARAAVAKPGDKPEAPETGRIVGNYSMVSTIEVGYRWEDTKGNRNRFLSEVNVRDGWRLLDFAFDARSINSDGALFDFLSAEVSNAGGDQSQYYAVRADKTRAYKFDGTMRRLYYFRNLPNFANNQHNYDLRQQISDFNLKLFPQRPVKINLGYGRAMARGPFISTYDYERDEFPINGRTRWEANDYRIGVDANVKRWDFFFEELIRGFRYDTENDQVLVAAGNNPLNNSVLTGFTRDEPTRSRAYFSKLSLRGAISSRAHLALRGVFGRENLDSSLFETTIGTDASNRRILNRRIVAQGESRRPSSVLDGLFSYDLAEEVTISNSANYSTYEIAGAVGTTTNSILQTPAGVITNTTANAFDLRGIDVDSFSNTLEVRFGVRRKLTGNLGWRVSRRQIELTTPDTRERVDQNTNSFIGGMRYRPVRRASLFLDYENGQSDNVFVRINPLEYQKLRLRFTVQATDTLSINTTFTTTDRQNLTRFVENDADFRAFAVAASWEPRARLWLAGGYDYNSIDSEAGIVFFLNNVRQQGRSVYRARQNFVFLDSRFGVTNRLDLFLVYRYIKDLGAPTRDLLTPPPSPNDFITALPLLRHNPEARLAFRFTNQITGNVSYRHYSYNERLFSIEDYRSNIVTTSVRFTF